MQTHGHKHSPPESRSDNVEIMQLLAGIVKKDEQAFASLYDKTINLLYGVALRITQNHDMTEEIINETYLQVWQQADRYYPEQSTVKSWLVMICRSRAIDALRRNRRSSDMDELQENLADTDALPLPDLMSAIEQESKLHAELNRLNHNQQQLLSLAFFRGFTHAELAEFLNMPLGTVKTQIRRAILELKKRMADQEDQQDD